MDAGKKLVGGLPSPFREQLLACFETQVGTRFGVRPNILNALRDAVTHNLRVRILYTRSGTWEQRWRLVDPRHIYMRQRTLYLYARTADEEPERWKVFRISRIEEIEPTGISINWRPGEDDGFLEKQRNAFDAFLGEKAYAVTLRFTGQARHYIRERQWHPSQELKEEANALIFTVRVAEPMELIRWARQFGDDAALLSREDPAGDESSPDEE